MPETTFRLTEEFRYFTVADLRLNNHEKLALPKGKLTPTLLFEDTINRRFGHAWGHLLTPEEAPAGVAVKFVEELFEFVTASLTLDLPDSPLEELLWSEHLANPRRKTPEEVMAETTLLLQQGVPVFDEQAMSAHRSKWMRKLAAEYADMVAVHDFARQLLPDAPTESAYRPNVNIIKARWVMQYKALLAGGRTSAVAELGELLAPTLNTLQAFLKRTEYAEAWEQVDEAIATRARIRGPHEGWTMTAMALPVGDPLANDLAAHPGWAERPASDANMASALDLSSVLANRTLTATR